MDIFSILYAYIFSTLLVKNIYLQPIRWFFSVMTFFTNIARRWLLSKLEWKWKHTSDNSIWVEIQNTALRATTQCLDGELENSAYRTTNGRQQAESNCEVL